MRNLKSACGGGRPRLSFSFPGRFSLGLLLSVLALGTALADETASPRSPAPAVIENPTTTMRVLNPEQSASEEIWITSEPVRPSQPAEATVRTEPESGLPALLGFDEPPRRVTTPGSLTVEVSDPAGARFGTRQSLRSVRTRAVATPAADPELPRSHEESVVRMSLAVGPRPARKTSAEQRQTTRIVLSEATCGPVVVGQHPTAKEAEDPVCIPVALVFPSVSTKPPDAGVQTANDHDHGSKAEGETRFGPFEVIDRIGRLSVASRRNEVIHTDADVYRTAVVNPSICEAQQLARREISIVGKLPGSTHVTFWFEDNSRRPITYLVFVSPNPEIREAAEMADPPAREEGERMLPAKPTGSPLLDPGGVDSSSDSIPPVAGPTSISGPFGHGD